MSGCIRNKDIRTLGYMMRRTNYGEADRILNIITPSGKIAAVAKGVRREKSKLAGSVEMFTLAEYYIHFGKGGLGIVTVARMKKYYSEIMKDLSRLETAACILKKVNYASDDSDSPDFFDIVDQGLRAIDMGSDLKMVEAWCLLNIGRTMGEEMNVYRDVQGRELVAGKKYDWDMQEKAFVENISGEYGTDDIKYLRLMAKGDLGLVKRIRVCDETIARALRLARIVV